MINLEVGSTLIEEKGTKQETIETLSYKGTKQKERKAPTTQETIESSETKNQRAELAHLAGWAA